MSTDAPTLPAERHPLGLPAGSIRALLALGIAATIWLCLSYPKIQHVPLYLQFLAFVILLFFASHGHTHGRPNESSPWHLPYGTVRFLLILGTLAVLIWQFIQDHESLNAMMEKLPPRPDELDRWSSLFAGTVGGYALGWLLSRGPWRKSPVYQDFVAWIALLSILALVGELMLRVFIDPNWTIQNRVVWETILVTVVSCYFGIRS